MQNNLWFTTLFEYMGNVVDLVVTNMGIMANRMVENYVVILILSANMVFLGVNMLFILSKYLRK